MSSILPQDPDSNTSHSPDWIAQGEDEDYIDYLTRKGDALCENPPPAPPGFELIECDATPRHFPTYAVTDSDFYPGICPGCEAASLMAQHAGCEHSHHGRWRRWRITHWLAGQLYVSGLAVSGGGKSWGGGCNWCLSSLPKFRRGERPYILWVKRDTWRCLLRGRHTPGDPIAFGFCSKCLPCPTCGSTTAGHLAGCEVRD